MVGGPTALRVLSHGIYFRALRTKCVIWQLTVDFDGLKNQTLAVAAVIRLCSENVCGVRVFYRRRVCVFVCVASYFRPKSTRLPSKPEKDYQNTSHFLIASTQ